MKPWWSNFNCGCVTLAISKITCVLFLGIGVLWSTWGIRNAKHDRMFSGFCQGHMKEHLCWDAQLWGYSLFSVYLQRCMNIWLMSHGLWRNLITVLLHKASSFTVNTAANSVTDTGALSASNVCCGVNSFLTRESMGHIIQLSVLNCCRLNLQTLICKDFSNGNKQWHVSQEAAVSPGCGGPRVTRRVSPKGELL